MVGLRMLRANIDEFRNDYWCCRVSVPQVHCLALDDLNVEYMYTQIVVRTILVTEEPACRSNTQPLSYVGTGRYGLAKNVDPVGLAPGLNPV